MKFLLLLYDDAARVEALPAADRRALVDEHIGFSRMLRERRVLVHGDPVDSPGTARTLRFHAEDGEPTVTDGPFLEAKEALGGFYVIECADAAEAEALAARLPRSPGLVAEIRPIPEV